MSNNVDLTLPEVQTTAQAPQIQPLQVPFARRRITLVFTLVNAGQTITVSGLRVVAHIDKVVWPFMGTSAWLKVYGLTLDHMDAISVAGLVYEVNSAKNFVVVQAGDDVLGLTTVFTGQIQEAYPNLDTAEDSHFYIYASNAALPSLKPVPATSYPGAGGVQAATVIQAMAQQAGFQFQNNGVTAVLSSPYFWGTAWQQIQSAVRAANCFAYVDDVTNTLTIWPKTGGTPSAGNITISPATGMIGYPKFQKSIIIVRTLFNPQVSYRPSLTVTIQSQLKAANGAVLIVNQVNYDLASEFPDGPWEMTIAGQSSNSSPPGGGQPAAPPSAPSVPAVTPPAAPSGF